jgi:hypothetical protein
MIPIQLAMPIKIWYKPLPRFPKTLWPIIDIKLTYPNRSLPQSILALVDSGASHSILHPEVAEALGFDQKKLGIPKYEGASVSGLYKSWMLPDELGVNIYGHLFSFKFSIINNPNLIWPCILGEDTIFQVARLDFQKFKGYFEVRFREDIN